MTVCLTGDVHHMSMETRDQAYMERTEVEAAIEYAEIAAEYDVPVTLFCTGKCIQEEPDRMERLAEMENVELGGHNYWAFTTPVHKGWRALEKVSGGRIGSWMGPRLFQAYEIRKTVSTFDRIGVSVTCWRDHAYRRDRHTTELLAANGIARFSDAVEHKGRIRQKDGLIVVPINTPPDHEHIYHAFQTPQFVVESDFEDAFGSKSLDAKGWRDWVIDTVVDRVEAGEPATVLCHPACMQLADGFEIFEQLCDWIGANQTGMTVPEIRS
jgi:hypothetical protein